MSDWENAGRALLEAEDRWVRLGTRAEAAGDHVAVRFAAAPGADGGNQFREIQLPAGADPDAFLAERMEQAGRWGWLVCRLEIDDRTYPANLGEWLGSNEFLPTVFSGLAAPAGAVREGAQFVPVREAGVDDTPLVESLLASQQVEERVGVEAAAAGLQLQRARFGSGRPRLLLAQLDERPAGLAVVLPHGTMHYVRKLYVAEPLRRRGVATALLRATADLAGEHGIVGLFADSATELAQYYRHRGFTVVTRRETWVREADAVV